MYTQLLLLPIPLFLTVSSSSCYGVSHQSGLYRLHRPLQPYIRSYSFSILPVHEVPYSGRLKTAVAFAKGRGGGGSKAKGGGRALTTLRVVSFSQHARKGHWCDTACDEYTSRLAGYDGARFGLEEVILRPAPGPPRQSDEKQCEQEGGALLGMIDSGEKLFVLDERGKSMTTMELAEEIRSLGDDGVSRITFAIGGASGHSDEVRRKAYKMIKLSDMVLNHMVARVLLVEQLYRAVTILLGIPYHK